MDPEGFIEEATKDFLNDISTIIEKIPDNAVSKDWDAGQLLGIISSSANFIRKSVEEKMQEESLEDLSRFSKELIEAGCTYLMIVKLNEHSNREESHSDGTSE